MDIIHAKIGHLPQAHGLMQPAIAYCMWLKLCLISFHLSLQSCGFTAATVTSLPTHNTHTAWHAQSKLTVWLTLYTYIVVTVRIHSQCYPGDQQPQDCVLQDTKLALPDEVPAEEGSEQKRRQSRSLKPDDGVCKCTQARCRHIRG